MRLKNRKKSAAAIKSMKVGTDELKDLIKGAVKEAMGEEDDTGDDGSDTAAALDGIMEGYGDIVRYGRPLFNSVEDERFPVPVIMPLCLTGDDISEVTFENFGKEVRLYLWERNAA